MENQRNIKDYQIEKNEIEAIDYFQLLSEKDIANIKECLGILKTTKKDTEELFGVCLDGHFSDLMSDLK